MSVHIAACRYAPKACATIAAERPNSVIEAAHMKSAIFHARSGSKDSFWDIVREIGVTSNFDMHAVGETKTISTCEQAQRLLVRF